MAQEHERVAAGQADLIEQQRRTISELETPVIQVWDGILALPIVGSLDTMRTQEMNEALLQRIVDTGSEIVILDITGVPVVDTAVARHLLETVSAARLLGAEVLIVGLSTRTALTLVHLGLDLAGVTTRTTMAKGLKLAFARLGLEVVPRRQAAERDSGAGEEGAMVRVPIIHIDDILLVTVQEDLRDRDALDLQQHLGEHLERTGAQGVLLDISVVETVDSFLGRLLNDIAVGARLLGAQTVVVGIQPAVAITLVELGLQLRGVHTALTPEKGRALLRRLLAREEWRDEQRG